MLHTEVVSAIYTCGFLKLLANFILRALGDKNLIFERSTYTTRIRKLYLKFGFIDFSVGISWSAILEGTYRFIKLFYKSAQAL